MRNSVLMSNERRIAPIAPASRDDLSGYIAHAQQTMGGCRLPPVLYKDRTIPAGLIGTRSL